MPRFISKSTGHRIGTANGNSLFKKKSVISETGRSSHHKNKIKDRTCNCKHTKRSPSSPRVPRGKKLLTTSAPPANN
jgi:hypothetical protein